MKTFGLALPFQTSANLLLRSFSAISGKTGKALVGAPKIRISDGNILYLLISIYVHGESLFARTIVRGQKGKSHLRLYDRITAEMKRKGLCTRALGGGRMDVRESDRKIKIYGTCSTFGRANHYATKDILKSSKKYGNFRISVRR